MIMQCFNSTERKDECNERIAQTIARVESTAASERVPGDENSQSASSDNSGCKGLLTEEAVAAEKKIDKTDYNQDGLLA